MKSDDFILFLKNQTDQGFSVELGFGSLLKDIFPGVEYFNPDNLNKSQEPSQFPVFDFRFLGSGSVQSTTQQKTTPEIKKQSLFPYGTGSMTTIRVDPPVLQDCSKTIHNSSTTLTAISGTINSCAKDAPDYDGQFGPVVRAIASGASAKASQLSGVYGNLSTRLADKAQQFLNADNISSAAIGSHYNNLAWMPLLSVHNPLNYTFGFSSFLKKIFPNGISIWNQHPGNITTPASPPTQPQIPSKFYFTSSPVPITSVKYTNWYGNTDLAYENRNTWYSKLQGLHSGLDFGCAIGTPITNPINKPGKVISIDNKQYNYGAGPHNVLVDYGDFLVLYGHTSSSNVKINDVVNPGEMIAKSGEDTNGYSHLHMEVIKKDENWSKLTPEQQAKTKPGNVRTNPVPYLDPSVFNLIKDKASGSSFHPLPDGKWGNPYEQPDIHPGEDNLVS